MIRNAVLIWLAAPSMGLALDPSRDLDQYVRRTWGRAEGLPQASVTAIVQDSEGYLWVGTFGGLVRFDGARFEIYRTSDFPGLPGDRIIALGEDRAGRIWIGTEENGASVYHDGRFTRFEPDDGLPLGLVGSFHQGSGETLWIACEGGLLGVDGQRTTRYTADDGLEGGEVTTVLETTRQGLVVGTTAGLFRLQGNRFRPFAAEIFGGVRIGTILETSGGELWVGGETGLFEVGDDVTAGQAPAVKLAAGPAIEDRDGNIWCSAQSLWRLNSVDDTSRRVVSMPLHGVRVVFEDREGSLWVGTDTEGLVQFRDGVAVSYPLFDRPVSAVPIVEDGAGGLWIGAPCVGLVHFSQSRISMYDEASGLLSPCVWSLLRDRSGNLWVGSYDGGINRLDGEGFPPVPGRQREVRALWQDRNGTLYAGTEDGLYAFDENGVSDRAVAGTQGFTIQFITQSPDETWWLGTTAGLRIASPSGSRSWTTAEGLSHNAVRAIYLDERGVAWIGTYGGGLNRLDNGEVTAFGRDEGFPDNVVSRIIEDQHHRLWMTSNNGVFNVRRAELDEYAAGDRTALDVEVLGVDSGLKNSECNGGGQPAGFLTDDGQLWVPTIEGIAVIDTEGSAQNLTPPPVRIERVVADRFSLATEGGVVHLPAGSRNLEVHYTALSFVRPESIRFRYTLVGFDSDWIDVGGRRVAYYPFLPPGDYEFRVMAFNADGVASVDDATVQIHLEPSLQQSLWFRVLVVILFVAAGLGVAWMRIRSLRADERRLAALVAMRTAELEEVFELTRKVNSGLVLEEVLDELYESFSSIIPYSRIGFAVISEDGSTVSALWARSDGEASGIPLGYSQPIESTSLTEVMQSKRPRILNDLQEYVREHPDSDSTRRILSEGMQSSLTVPLHAMNSPVGFLFFSSRLPRAYEDVHTELFEQIAVTLSQIVIKSRLYGELLATRQQLEEANRELRALASLDGLTAIPNRRSFDLRLDQEWRRAVRTTTPVALLMIDIDNFKDFNDLHGHQSGDACLRMVAEVLQNGLRRAGDFIARYGGEEFVVILPETNVWELERVGRMLLRNVEASMFPHPETGEELHVTISVGGSCTIPVAASSARDLLAAADHAMYEAKRAGKNRYVGRSVRQASPESH